MKRTLARVFAAAVVVVTAAGTANASLLTNGSFEDNTGFVDNTGGGAMLLNVGSTAITGWTIAGGGTVLWAGPGSVSYMGGLVPSDGSYFLDLTGLTNQCGPTCGGVSQQFSSTAATTYQLTFDFGGRGDSIPVVVLADAGGPAQAFTTYNVTTTAAGYDHGALQFTGTGNLMTISLVGGNAGASGLDISLDNVDLAVIQGGNLETPLPAAWIGMLGGLASLGFLGYRRKKIGASATA